MSNNKQTKKEGWWWPFSGGCSFYMKNKLKAQIFNGKKFIKKIFFSVMAKNLNGEISTKNLATFKRWGWGYGWKILILLEFPEKSDFFEWEGENEKKNNVWGWIA